MSACQGMLLADPAIPSPCFVLDEDRLLANAAILRRVQEQSGARILLALKAFAAFDVFHLLSRASGDGPLWGVCASSVDEARLGREYFGGEVHAFAAAWSDAEMASLLPLADHIVFNSPGQWRHFAPRLAQYRTSAGLRLNPEHSEGAPAIYNPCSPGSRLGARAAAIRDEDLSGLDGLHFHSLCEQGADALERTLAALEKKFGAQLAGRKWINFGGGHHITRPGYDVDLLCRLIRGFSARYGAQIYLEPGEAVALDAGWLTATVLDIVEADMPTAILDVSAACHMPDVLEMPYRPRIFYSGADGLPAMAGSPGDFAFSARLAGKSCLAGDVIGEYSFARPPAIGDRLLFADMAIYSMVKTTTFNGLRLPSIGICRGSGFRLLRSFGYEDFRSRLGSLQGGGNGAIANHQ